jgi:hypothetical protein
MKPAAQILLAAVVALAPATARAQGDPDTTIAKVVDLNRQAVSLYKKRKYEDARKALKQALDLCEAAGLQQHPVAARTRVHLGVVIAGGFGQREIGAKQFAAALRIQPDITLTPGLDSPEMKDAFHEAAVSVTSAPAPARAFADESAPAPVVEDVPRVQRRPAVRTRASDDRDDDEDDDAAPVRASRVQLGALVGGGVGWASGFGDVNGDAAVPGAFAAAKLGHVAAEAGYWVLPSLMLSAQGRFQYVTGPTIVEAMGHRYKPASGATAVFGVATWSPSAGRGRLQPFLSGGLGGGAIRHVVSLSAYKDCGPARNETCVDTVAAGPLLVSAGAGLLLDLGDSVGLVAAVNTQVGAPKFTFNVDFNGGLAFHL